MNRRDMKKLLYRELSFFLNSSRQQWSSIPNWFHNVRNNAFRQGADYGTEAEKRRLEEVMSDLMIELLNRGGK